MNKCKCGSYAINPHLHGRDNTDLDLCDVCYWRKRANNKQPKRIVGNLKKYDMYWDIRGDPIMEEREDGEWFKVSEVEELLRCVIL